MSLRVFKTLLKQTNAADKEAREMQDSARAEEAAEGLAHGHGLLHDYALAALADARWHYVRLKHSFKKLRPRQRKKMICQVNARAGIRNTLDKIL